MKVLRTIAFVPNQVLIDDELMYAERLQVIWEKRLALRAMALGDDKPSDFGYAGSLPIVACRIRALGEKKESGANALRCKVGLLIAQSIKLCHLKLRARRYLRCRKLLSRANKLSEKANTHYSKFRRFGYTSGSFIFNPLKPVNEGVWCDGMSMFTKRSILARAELIWLNALIVEFGKYRTIRYERYDCILENGFVYVDPTNQ